MIKTFQVQQNKLSSRQLIERSLKYTMSSSSLYGTDVMVEEQRQLVDNIARHIVYGESKQLLLTIIIVNYNYFLNQI